MEEYLVLLSGIFFIAFLLPVRARKYFGMLGWAGMVLFLFAEIPYYFSINNFLYPLIAVLSVPFLAITVKYLNRENLRVMQLTRAASVAFLIYAPFAFTPLGDWLISVVVGQVVWLLDAFGYPASLYAWNTIIRNGFRVEIILACTGIQAIAIMLGVAAAVKTTMRQKVAAFLLVVPTIYILNLIRNTAVIIAYTEQWFPYLTEIAGNGELGYESFFWAHNVFAELMALVLLVAIAYGLFRLIPELARFATELFGLYLDEVRRVAGRKKTSADPPEE
jgi:archaeosortase A (PGF-CTERM-specific)